MKGFKDGISESEKAALAERFIASEEQFSGRVFTVEIQDVELADGSRAKREIVKHHGGACVLAIDSEFRVPLVLQHRAAFKSLLYEIPAGKLEPGEEALACAQRELKEECGLTAKSWQELAVLYPSPGYDTEVITIFLAQDILDTGVQDLDEGEFLKVKKLPFDDLFAAVMRGQIKDAKTQIAVLKAWHLLRSKSE
ncbi:MAG: NUDIX hydrolase [Eubacteriales bacterium]|nr:NUDIX hydrolase [Eubacteriales bacterium]